MINSKISNLRKKNLCIPHKNEILIFPIVQISPERYYLTSKQDVVDLSANLQAWIKDNKKLTEEDYRANLAKEYIGNNPKSEPSKNTNLQHSELIWDKLTDVNTDGHIMQERKISGPVSNVTEQNPPNNSRRGSEKIDTIYRKENNDSLKSPIRRLSTYEMLAYNEQETKKRDEVDDGEDFMIQQQLNQNPLMLEMDKISERERYLAMQKTKIKRASLTGGDQINKPIYPHNEISLSNSIPIETVDYTKGIYTQSSYKKPVETQDYIRSFDELPSEIWDVKKGSELSFSNLDTNSNQDSNFNGDLDRTQRQLFNDQRDDSLYCGIDEASGCLKFSKKPPGSPTKIVAGDIGSRKRDRILDARQKLVSDSRSKSPYGNMDKPSSKNMDDFSYEEQELDYNRLSNGYRKNFVPYQLEEQELDHNRLSNGYGKKFDPYQYTPDPSYQIEEPQSKYISTDADYFGNQNLHDGYNKERVVPMNQKDLQRKVTVTKSVYTEDNDRSKSHNQDKIQSMDSSNENGCLFTADDLGN